MKDGWAPIEQGKLSSSVRRKSTDVQSASLSRIQSVFPVLRNVPTALAQQLAALRPLTLPVGSVLFDVGAACTGFPLLLAGEVRVQTIGANGRMLHLYQVNPGESCVITQSCLLGRRDYNAHGSARTAIELCLLPASLFDALVATHPPFREFVFALFGERFVDLMTIVDEIAFKRLDQRLARLLFERGPQLKTTHQALADDLGSVREIVTRLLRQFAEEGLVGLVPLATGLMRFCPFYPLFGISSCPR